MTPQDRHKTAQTLRDAGVLIFERRCWHNEIEGNDGSKKYRIVYGCGSYFRWVLGSPALCPFCGHQWDYYQRFPYTNSELWPPTLNYTGQKGTLSEEEEALVRLGYYQEVTT
jgi:hypothetical protein